MNWPRGKNWKTPKITTTMKMMMPRNDICRRKMRLWCHCRIICDRALPSDRRKCCPIKCWTVYPKWTWASMPKYETSKRQKWRKISYWWSTAIVKTDRPNSCRLIWQWILCSTIDVSVILHIMRYLVFWSVDNLYKIIIKSTVNIEDPEVKRQRQQQIEAKRAARGEGTGTGGTKRATDDYHYDKFRKQFRR